MTPDAFRFRPNTIDNVVFRHIVTENEYRIPTRLDPNSLIIDIGAHIGSFSYLCWCAGARFIEAFEADPDNADLARENLANTGITVVEKAVWRSDVDVDKLHHSGYVDMCPDGPDPVSVNTGGGHVFASSGLEVATISLDDVIGDRKISLLKIDCEGSEYPILLTSKRLCQVRRIVGEYHLVDKSTSSDVAGLGDSFTPGSLFDYLVSQRFRVEFCSHPDPRFSLKVGTFFADNIDLL